MKPFANACAHYRQSLATAGYTVVASAALILSAVSAMAQPKAAWPASVTTLAQTLITVSGVPTLLTVNGSGNCKFRLSYLKQDAPNVTAAPLIFSSTPQNPFPLNLKIWDATPAGTYTWTATGIEGCMGSRSLTFTVR